MLQVKFQKPFLDSQIISRPRVNRIFESKPNSILVCAPAGYGKSVAVSQWLEIQSGGYMWLSLDEEQNDVSSFLEYFITGIEAMYPNHFSESKAFIYSHHVVDEEIFREMFINEMITLPESLIIVLEDYHFITNPFVHSLIEQIIKLLSRQLKMILVTRVDPPINTINLKLYGMLHEIRMNELSLSHEEFQNFIDHQLKIKPSGKEIEQLEQLTEGWILGVKIAMSFGNISEFIPLNSSFSMSQDIGHLVKKLTEYLEKELSELLLVFAMCEKFNEELLLALIEHKGKTWTKNSDIIQVLIEHNLFLIQLDAQGIWYRFHHLFRDLLIQIADKKDPYEAQKTLIFICNWFAERGMIEEAIRYAVKAGQLGLATKLVAKYRFDAINSDQWWRVQRWLNLIPEQVRKSSPDLLLAQILIYQDTWQLSLIPAMLAALKVLLPQDISLIHRAEILYHQGHLQVFIFSNPNKAIELLEKSKRLLDDQSILSVRREMFLAVAYQMVGKTNGALQSLNEFEAKYEPGSQLYLRAMFSKMMVLLLSGNLKKGNEVAERFTFFARNCGFESLEAYSCYMMTNVALHRLNIPQSMDLIDRAMLFQGKMNYRLYFDSMVMKVLALSIERKFDDVEKTLDKICSLANQLQDHSYLSYYKSAVSRAKWLQGESESVLSWAETRNDQMHFSQSFFLIDVPALTQCRILISTGNPAQQQKGLLQLDEIESCLNAVNNRYYDVDIKALRSLAAFRSNDLTEAKEMANEAILLAKEKESWLAILEMCISNPKFFAIIDKEHLTPFLQKVFTRIIDTADKSKKLSQNNEYNKVQISLREEEILRAVAEGMRNKEIAETLNISEVTVKSHLTNVFRKMDVPNRTTMLLRARELKIL